MRKALEWIAVLLGMVFGLWSLLAIPLPRKPLELSDILETIACLCWILTYSLKR